MTREELQELRTQAVELTVAGYNEREISERIGIDLDQVRRMIGGTACPGCEE